MLLEVQLQPRLIRHDATTRVAGPASAVDAHRQMLVTGQIVKSPETRLAYRVQRLLGEGGYGQVYLVKRLGRSAAIPATVCLKVSRHMDGWLREAYFGQLLTDDPRAICVFDRFPVHIDGQLLYCLALEYARHGDLSSYLQRTASGWPERLARREIAGILQVLGRLHRGRVLHRDLTPLNVFVCDSRRLKLGDFGIVREQHNQRGITTRTLNRSMVPSDMIGNVAPKWRARDDVYQMGQLLAMLVKGDARARVRTREVRGLACSDELKEIIYRCIGERRKRYESADELIDALKRPPPRLRAGVLKTLKGVHLAFTGILTRKRTEAIRAARRAGAVIHGMASTQTTVVVRGRPNPLQAAGREGGRKLMEIKRLRQKGHRITIVDEASFWRLVDRPTPGRR